MKMYKVINLKCLVVFLCLHLNLIRLLLIQLNHLVSALPSVAAGTGEDVAILLLCPELLFSIASSCLIFPFIAFLDLLWLFLFHFCHILGLFPLIVLLLPSESSATLLPSCFPLANACANFLSLPWNSSN